MSENEEIEQQTQTSNPATPVVDKENEEKPKTPVDDRAGKSETPGDEEPQNSEDKSNAEQTQQSTTSPQIGEYF